MKITKYLSATETAFRLGLSNTRIKLLARQNRLQGAIKIGEQWAIPSPPKVLPPAK